MVAGAERMRGGLDALPDLLAAAEPPRPGGRRAAVRGRGRAVTTTFSPG